jgi:hypothetical protein
VVKAEDDFEGVMMKCAESGIRRSYGARRRSAVGGASIGLQCSPDFFREEQHALKRFQPGLFDRSAGIAITGLLRRWVADAKVQPPPTAKEKGAVPFKGLRLC